MKEYLKSLDCEDYHKVVYPSIISGEMVGQHTTDGDILLVPNEERYLITKPCEERPAYVVPNPSQGKLL